MCILIFTVSPLRPITLPTFLDGTSITTVSTLEEWWIACPENGGEISRILQTWAAAPMFDGWVFLQAGRHLGCLCDRIIIYIIWLLLSKKNKLHIIWTASECVRSTSQQGSLFVILLSFSWQLNIRFFTIINWKLGHFKHYHLKIRLPQSLQQINRQKCSCSSWLWTNNAIFLEWWFF